MYAACVCVFPHLYLFILCYAFFFLHPYLVAFGCVFVACSPIPRIDARNRLNRSCGRLLTMKDDENHWKISAQCVLIDPHLLVTAAHACFYHLTKPKPKSTRGTKKIQEEQKEQKEQRPIPYHLSALFILDDGKQLQLDVYPVRWSGSMDIAILYIPEPSPELQILPLASSTSPDPSPTIYLATYRQYFDSTDITKKRPLSRLPLIDKGHIMFTVDENTDIMSFPLYNCSYSSNSGDSGAAVLHLDEYQRIFRLIGINLGQEYLENGVDSVLRDLDADSTIPAKKVKPNTDVNESADEQQETSANSISQSTNSDIPQDQETKASTFSSESLIHAQTNPGSAYFIPLHSIFNRAKWSVEYILTNNPSSYADNSPPRISTSASSLGVRTKEQHSALRPLRLFPDSLSLYDE